MAQEFTIKSEAIESKINQLLPTQGGFGAGVDFSASTMVIPIVDLTETAEGSDVRQDLQTAFSYTTTTSGTITNTTSVIINTTGYYRVFGTIFSSTFASSSGDSGFLFLSDGSVDKTIFKSRIGGNSNYNDSFNTPFDLIVFIKPGITLEGTSEANGTSIFHASRQIADLDGNLINP
jgi:hypothetical protein